MEVEFLKLSELMVVVLCVDGDWFPKKKNRNGNCEWLNDFNHLFLLINSFKNKKIKSKNWLKEEWKNKIKRKKILIVEIDWLINVDDKTHFIFFKIKNKYLVDPASSHMLVLKIKPCMPKFRWKRRTETADGSINQS